MSYEVAVESKYASDEPIKTKRPGFIARWFLKKVLEGTEFERRQNRLTSNSISSISVDRSIDQPERAIQFTVYNANGGRVVETRRYDKKTDRSSNGLYVITSDADFGKEIDKIITMEALKQ